MLSQLKRFLLLLPETLLFGATYARFLYRSRSTQPLEPQETWDYFTKPQHPFVEWFYANYPPSFFRRLFRDVYYRQSFSFKEHQVGISEHYDISNKFYQLFLDKTYMFYSAGDFINATDTLEDAQENKANYLLNLIHPQPEEKILELGCGWGAMLKKIHKQTSHADTLYGYTLSQAQKNFIDEQYGFNVELKNFITLDYEANAFDTIFSIGSIEHVRENELLPLCQNLSKALKPSGKLVHQFFCQMEDVIPTRLIAVALNIFPGSELTSFKKHLDIFEQANLKVIHHSIHDYRPTLEAWFNRLVANQTAAIELVGVQNYNKYQCYLAEAWRLFNDRDLMLMRFVLKKP